MTPSIQTAVILAAGTGTRLGEKGKRIPKGFIKLGEMTIIEESIENLLAVGIRRVVIVAGHLKEFYDDLSLRMGGLVQTVVNPVYRESGSMYSLFLGAREIQEGFLLLESDIIFERRALTELVRFSHQDAILISGETNASDEVYVRVNGERVVGISKSKDGGDGSIAGEFVGISKISLALKDKMLSAGTPLFDSTLHVDYESVLERVAQRHDLHWLRIPDLLWAEIDCGFHLNRAQTIIYPAISKERHSSSLAWS